MDVMKRVGGKTQVDKVENGELGMFVVCSRRGKSRRICSPNRECVHSMSDR
jgi:hypothetical protein